MKDNQYALAERLRYARSRLSAGSEPGQALESIGNILLQWGRAREAIPYLIDAAHHRDGDRTIAFNLAWAYLSCGEAVRADEFSKLPEDLSGVDVEFALIRVAALRMLDRRDEAFSVLNRLAMLRPLEFDVHGQLTVSHRERANPEYVIGSANEAIHINPLRPMPHAMRGQALHLIGMDRHADDAYQRAMGLEDSTGERIDAYVGYGNFLRETGRTDDALSLYRTSLSRSPSYAGSGDYALALLTAGQLAEAWEGYEFRWINAALSSFRTPFEKPLWQGQDLKGKTILLRDEQGVGDCIQFIRYAAHVDALGGNVVMQARDSWRDIATSVEGVDRFLTPQDPLPPFDFYCHLMSLPRVFGTSLGTIPADVPYIKAKAERVARWAGQVKGGAGLKVGLVWAGNPSHLRDQERSLNLLQLAPLLGVEGVKFFALQKGARSEQANDYAAANWMNLGPELADFSDTAAVIDSLDLVICVDTSVAHLAGAMAKPVWLLLPKPSDFRWMEDREDSPWYPTMRLFRQPSRGDWKDVIGRVKAALVRQVQEGAAPSWVKKPFVALTSAFPSQWVAGVTKLPGHRPGFSAVAETRVGMVQYLPDEPVMGDAIAWYGEYLQPHVDMLSTRVAPGSTVMEIDAGIGLHALALAKMVGPTGYLMLYEPDAIKNRILGQNLEVHGIRHAVIMRRRIGRIAEEEAGSEGPNGKPDHETLDDLQLERLDWLKINGEQRALEVLSRADETIWRLRPKLLITGDDGSTSMAELQNRLHDLGYRCSMGSISLYNLSNYNERKSDIFQGVICATLIAIPEESND